MGFSMRKPQVIGVRSLPSVEDLDSARKVFLESDSYRAGLTTAPRVLDVIDALTEARRSVDGADIRGAVEWVGAAYEFLNAFQGLAKVCDTYRVAHGHFVRFVDALVRSRPDDLRNAQILRDKIPGYNELVAGNA